MYSSYVWRGSVVWPNARAWRAREPQGSVGSNPTLSAWGTRKGVLFSCLLLVLTLQRWNVIRDVECLGDRQWVTTQECRNKQFSIISRPDAPALERLSCKRIARRLPVVSNLDDGYEC